MNRVQIRMFDIISGDMTTAGVTTEAEAIKIATQWQKQLVGTEIVAVADIVLDEIVFVSK